ncbi:MULTISPECIES: heavy metal translocating P-type ATPase [unclassified Enterococcus]|uniref:heavy metal translocating P-type ATPase n=1 Tax=unclassified Enterococcus TaxID=2608891 RepID=UPI0013ED950F|nr:MULTISPECIES: heavy metal translocating P-type ATPase [unclassified Enterococcus]
MKYQKMILGHKTLITIITGSLILVAEAARFLFQQPILYTFALAIASVIGFLPIAIQAFQAARVKVISIDLLVSIAVAGAFIIGEYSESAIVEFLFLFGHFLEQKTLEKTRSAIQKLVQLAPASAWKIVGETIEKVAIEEVAIGDTLLVKTGAQIPVDGIVTEGNGYVNEASVTGESNTVHKTNESRVFAGTILDNGTLKVQAQRVGEDTTFGKIIELVEEAQDSKSNAEDFIDRFAKYYTPFVLLLAVVVGFISMDVRLAITILVLGCPGALIIGVPVSNVAGIGNGAKNGILIKGSEVMDIFHHVDTMVFDKTGTLTNGKPSVAVIKEYTSDASVFLGLAAAAERESDHPLGEAIVQYADKRGLSDYSDYQLGRTIVHKGKGIEAEINGQPVLIGNQQLMNEQKISLAEDVRKEEEELQATGHSTVFLAVDREIVQLIGIKDQIRPGVKETLVQLKQEGIKQLIMLTGDNQLTAEHTGRELDLTEIHGGLLPEQKAAFIRKLQQEGNIVAFVGDGINDSPSIALADIGIAMGNGTDVAIETSDIVLMQSSFKKLVHAYQLTKKTMANMKENIAIAIGTVLLLLSGLLLGRIYMASGMLFHEMSILVVVINGMRLLSYRTKRKNLDTNQLSKLKEQVE